ELATVAPIPGTYFAPSSADWIRDTTDISQFDGEAEVIFRLKGFNPPGGSNLLFLDDIDIAPLSPVGVEDAGILTRMEVFPNPVKDQINIQVNSQEKATASIQLYDVHGKMISVLDRSLNLFAGENQKSYNVSAIHSGVYNLKIVTDKGVRNHFIQIQ
ncbi:MAG: T9SS type A sorting domain-containing protein, partial [Saprospiraceae bacterium]